MGVKTMVYIWFLGKLCPTFAFFVTLADAELTCHSEMERKTSFPFSFHSFFRNFG